MNEPPTPDVDPTEPMRMWLVEQLAERKEPDGYGLYHWPATLEQYEALASWPHLDKIGRLDGDDVIALGCRVKRPVA